jgi:hypothetical protein
MRKAFALFGFMGCGSSTAIHVLTFFGIDPMMKWPALWILHVAAMLAMLSAFFSGNVTRPSKFTRSTVDDIFGPWDASEAQSQLEKSWIGTETERAQAEEIVVRRFRARPVAIVLVCLSFYALANFAISMSLLGGGNPEQQGESYRLTSHGKVLKELTPSEYQWYRAYRTRCATGFWMVLFCTAGVLWQAPRRRAKEWDAR